MKRTLIAAIALSLMLLTAGVASAHGRFGARIFIGPPVFAAPVPVPYPYYYRSYPYYDPDPYGYREWVPGHWEGRRGYYGSERVWIPGHWDGAF